MTITLLGIQEGHGRPSKPDTLAHYSNQAAIVMQEEIDRLRARNRQLEAAVGAISGTARAIARQVGCE